MRTLVTILVLVSLALLTGCGPHPRAAPMALGQAGSDRTPRQMLIVKVWDQTDSRLVRKADAMVSHYIEVEVQGRPVDDPLYLTLPYDELSVGHVPPEPGEIVVVAPADWVQKDPRSLMRWQAGR